MYGKFSDWDTLYGILKNENRLLKLTGDRFVFAGDTHGDVEATDKVLSLFPTEKYTLVFLGDYVDRGMFSRENLTLLFETKIRNPDRIFLLCGNHEAYHITPFVPADFWESLTQQEFNLFSSIFSALPLAALIGDNIIALHGAPPDVPSVEAIEKIEEGTPAWRQIVWGDLYDKEGYLLGELGSRVAFGRDYFYSVTERLGINLTIRAHQTNIKTISFNGRCVTLITSAAYSPLRRIAILEKSKSDYGLEVGEI